MLNMLAMIVIALAAQVVADPDRMAQIDRSFVCPENLPSDAARVQAIAKFDAKMAQAVKDLTLDQLGEARMYLLRKHRCFATLDTLKANGVR
ncbi:hypothetical protein [Sphingomonas sp. UYP23]